MLILGRGLQGIGGGGIVPLAQSIIADAVPPRERGYYQAYTGSIWVLAGAGGPVLGGVIAEHLHWSMIFWLNVPLAFVAALLSHRQLKLLPRHERAHKIDLTGAALMMLSAIALVAGADLGRHALSVAVAADRVADRSRRRCCRRCSSGGCCGCRSRFCRLRC